MDRPDSVRAVYQGTDLSVPELREKWETALAAEAQIELTHGGGTTTEVVP
ncbi:MAG: hypothetical protein KGM47_11930 [Acidobacteriota bacterium]|nr:hypothetical protein [Acidobacteriota bacterium]